MDPSHLVTLAETDRGAVGQSGVGVLNELSWIQPASVSRGLNEWPDSLSSFFSLCICSSLLLLPLFSFKLSYPPHSPNPYIVSSHFGFFLTSLSFSSPSRSYAPSAIWKSLCLFSITNGLHSNSSKPISIVREGLLSQLSLLTVFLYFRLIYFSWSTFYILASPSLSLLFVCVQSEVTVCFMPFAPVWLLENFKVCIYCFQRPEYQLVRGLLQLPTWSVCVHPH